MEKVVILRSKIAHEIISPSKCEYMQNIHLFTLFPNIYFFLRLLNKFAPLSSLKVGHKIRPGDVSQLIDLKQFLYICIKKISRNNFAMHVPIYAKYSPFHALSEYLLVFKIGQ